MKRFRRNSPFSLFAFQDIVTGLCGIVIFFVLIMCLDLAEARDSIAEQADVVNVEADDDCGQLHAEIARLKAELSSIKEAAREVIVSAGSQASPEVAARFNRNIEEKEREIAALISQTDDLRTKVAAAEDADAQSRATIREMEETRRIFEKRLADMKRKKGVTLIPERGEFKSPIYLIMGRGGVEVVRPLRKSVERLWFSFDEVEDGLFSELVKFDHTTHTVVLLVRPSGVGKMQYVANRVRSYGYSCGRDPLEEDVDVSIATVGGE